MATVTPNFNWPVPTSTDLVKDGATAIEALGDSIDASLVDLKGGTSGQVLSKNSNTDMDFVWVTSDDANAIQNTIVDAKGDLITATAADTPARLAVGNNGETLVADSSTSTGLRYNPVVAAAKNVVIGGGFDNWQRGTSFSANGVYTADRWQWYLPGTGVGSLTQQTFTPGAAPVAGYEAQYFARSAVTTVGSSSYTQFLTRIEDVRTFAGQTATISFWARVNSGAITGSYVRLNQFFGSGGSASVTGVSNNYTPTGSWARYSATVAIPSISGKTVGSGSFLEIDFVTAFSATNALDIWGVQLELGSVATNFGRAGGTIQGELGACQRYYWRLTPGVVSGYLLTAGNAYNATNLVPNTIFPQTMRIAPTSVDYSAIQSTDGVNVADVTTLTMYYPTTNSANFIGATTGATQYRNYALIAKTTSSYLGFSAEL